MNNKFIDARLMQVVPREQPQIEFHARKEFDLSEPSFRIAEERDQSDELRVFRLKHDLEQILRSLSAEIVKLQRCLDNGVAGVYSIRIEIDGGIVNQYPRFDPIKMLGRYEEAEAKRAAKTEPSPRFDPNPTVANMKRQLPQTKAEPSPKFDPDGPKWPDRC